MHSITFRFLTVLLFTLLLSVSQAATQEIIPVTVDKIFVPESNFHSFLESTRGEKLRAFSISDLQKLVKQDFRWRTDDAGKKKMKESKLPYKWAIINSSLKGSQIGLELAFHAKFVVETTTKGMHIIPILGNGISITKATVNGEPARLISKRSRRKGGKSPFSVIVDQNNEGVSKHVIEADFLVPIKPVEYYHKSSFAILPAPSTNMTVTIEGTNLDVSIPSGLGITQTQKSKKTEIQAYLKPSAHIEITWFRLSRNNKTTKSETEPSLSDIKSEKDKSSPAISKKQLWLESTIFQEIEIGEGRVDGTVRVHLKSYRKPVSQITIKTLNKTNFMNLSLINIGDTVEKWDSDKEKGTINIEFRHPQEGRTSLLFVYHSDTRGKSTFKTTIPEFAVNGAKRENGYIAIRRRTIVEIAIENKSKTLNEIPLSTVPSEYINNGVKKSLLIYRYLTHPFNLELSVKRYGDAPVLTTVIDSVKASTAISRNGNCFTKLVYTIRSRTKAPLEFNVATMGKTATIEEVLLNNKETALSYKTDGTLEVSLAPVKGLSADETISMELWCSHKIREFNFTGSNAISLPTVGAEVKKINWSLAVAKEYKCFGFFGNYGKRSSERVPLPFPTPSHQVRSKYYQYSIERALLPAGTTLTVNYSYIKTSALNLPVVLFFFLGIFIGHSILLILTREENNSPYLSALVAIIVVSILFSRQIGNFIPYLFLGLLFYGLLLLSYITYRGGVILRRWWTNRKNNKDKKDLNAVETNIARVHGEVEGGDDSE